MKKRSPAPENTPITSSPQQKLRPQFPSLTCTSEFIRQIRIPSFSHSQSPKVAKFDPWTFKGVNLSLCRPPQPILTKKPTETLAVASTVVAFAVQCNTCFKWRKVTEEHFEDFRSNYTKEPFICTILPETTCEKPADINYNEPPEVWVMDKPDLPKTPNGFKRVVTIRRNCSKSEVKFIPPQGKIIRTRQAMEEFLQQHPEYSHLSLSDFPFTAPTIMRETIPEHVVKKKKQKLEK